VDNIDYLNNYLEGKLNQQNTKQSLI